MDYETLKKIGTKLFEQDYYDNGNYAGTEEFWKNADILYRVENRPNSPTAIVDSSTGKEVRGCLKSYNEYGIWEFLRVQEQNIETLTKAFEEKFPVTKLSELREKTGLSRAAFAEALGIPYRTMEDWEKGERQITDYIYELIEFKIENTLLKSEET